MTQHPIDDRLPDHRFDGAKDVPSRTTDSSAPVDGKGLEAFIEAMRAEGVWFGYETASKLIRAYIAATTPTDQPCLSPLPDTDTQDDLGEAARKLRDFGRAYSEEIFSPVSAGERSWLHKERPGLQDRIAADMGRHLAEFMDDAADTIDKATILLAEKDAEIEQANADHDKSLEELGRIIMSLPSGTRSEGALAGVKTLKARAEAAEAELAKATSALKEIATGRDKDGLKVDFPAEIARAFINGGGE